MSEIAPKPVGVEARRELHDYAKLLNDLSGSRSVLYVMRRQMAAGAYREMADKVHISLYLLYQIYDWLLVHQAELVQDILVPFHCPRCDLRIHPPEPVEA
ncbi:hypothetical protein [Streptosporangium sp. G12]